MVFKLMTDGEIRSAVSAEVAAAMRQQGWEGCSDPNVFADDARLWADGDQAGLMRHENYGGSTFVPVVTIDTEAVDRLRVANKVFRW